MKEQLNWEISKLSDIEIDKEIVGIYFLFLNEDNPTTKNCKTICIGQCLTPEKIRLLKEDVLIMQYEEQQYDVYIAWAEKDKNLLDGIQQFLYTKLRPETPDDCCKQSTAISLDSTFSPEPESNEYLNAAPIEVELPSMLKQCSKLIRRQD